MTAHEAKFIGVGVGPGDPELVTLKAARLIHQADVISYLANDQGHSQARSIVSDILTEKYHGQALEKIEEIPLLMPMLEDRQQANQVYDKGASTIVNAIKQGKTVVFLCEGDPLFFGSFAYLLERLQDQVSCQIVPGITSVNAAASVMAQPLTVLTESFAVISGRHDQQRIERTLNNHESVVIMKAGRARPKILQALKATGRIQEATYLEYIGRENQKIVQYVDQLPDQAGPYFSLFVVLSAQRTTR